MDTIVVIVLVVLGLVVVVGLVVAYVALRNAPDGFEDRKGFHPDGKPKP